MMEFPTLSILGVETIFVGMAMMIWLPKYSFTFLVSGAFLCFLAIYPQFLPWVVMLMLIALIVWSIIWFIDWLKGDKCNDCKACVKRKSPWET